jgi:hypothetical protein
MEFVSPFQLFALLNVEISERYSKLQFKQVRKMWMAEFELNGNEPILINENYYSRGEVVKILDRITTDPLIYNFELKVFRCPELSFFMRGNAGDPIEALPELPASYYDSDFINYISPLIAPRFQQEFSKNFPYNRRGMLNRLFTFYGLLTEKDLVIPLYKINMELEKIFSKVNSCLNLYKTTHSLTRLQIYSCIYGRDVVLLNILPVSFQARRNEMAIKILKVYEAASLLPDSENFSRRFLNNALLLNTDEEIQALIRLKSLD